MPKPGGTIYAIGAQGTPWVKIGFTRTPVEARLRVLQTGQPFPLHIIAAQPVEADVQRIEKQVHDFLAGERRRGEWFEMPMDMPTLEALIVRAITALTLLEEPPPRAIRSCRPTRLGQRIRLLRQQQRLSQVELAKRVGISKTAMNDIESGQTRDPRFSIVERISKALGVSMDRFEPEDAA